MIIIDASKWSILVKYTSTDFGVNLVNVNLELAAKYKGNKVILNNQLFPFVQWFEKAFCQN